MPINGALSLRPVFPLTWEEGGDTRESGVTQKPRLRLKRPIVFPMESRVWDLGFRGAEGLCVSEARQGQDKPGNRSSLGCRALPGPERQAGLSPFALGRGETRT